MNKIEQFIKDNKLVLEGGSKGNSTIVTLIGYALYLGLSLEELLNSLDKKILLFDDVEKEITRLWDYCKKKKYNSFWLTDKAKKEYKF